MGCSRLICFPGDYLKHEKFSQMSCFPALCNGQKRRQRSSLLYGAYLWSSNQGWQNGCHHRLKVYTLTPSKEPTVPIHFVLTHPSLLMKHGHNILCVYIPHLIAYSLYITEKLSLSLLTVA